MVSRMEKSNIIQMLRVVSIIILTFFTTPLFTQGQVRNVSIEIFASHKNYWLKLRTDLDKHKAIVYLYRIDSLSDVYFDYTDAYLKNPNLSKEDILRFRFIRDTQEIRYAWFISDTFTIDLKKNRAFRKVVNDMLQAEKTDFANQMPNVVTADGTSFSILIQRKKQLLSARGHSPVKERHPLLYKYLHELYMADKERGKQSFLHPNYQFCCL